MAALTFNVRKQNLFDLAYEGYWLAHCVSADLAMGAGIATQFVKIFDERRLLKEKYPKALQLFDKTGFSLFVDSGNCIYNLVTKKYFYQKPTYDSLEGSLHLMRRSIDRRGVSKLAMPKIGCGLDRLDWKIVKAMITRVLDNPPKDLEVTVCVLS